MAEKGIPWPRRCSKLFASRKEGKSFHLKSIMQGDPVQAESCKLAADMVIDHYENDDRAPHYDRLFFPVMYLYRHGLENKLKDMIWIGVYIGFFDRQKTKEQLPHMHGLAPLWTKVKKLLVAHDLHSDRAAITAVERAINDLHQIDPNGQMLRYEYSKQWQRHRYDKLPDFISISNLREVMDEIYTFFSCCEGCLRGLMESQS